MTFPPDHTTRLLQTSSRFPARCGPSAIRMLSLRPRVGLPELIAYRGSCSRAKLHQMVENSACDTLAISPQQRLRSVACMRKDWTARPSALSRIARGCRVTSDPQRRLPIVDPLL